MAAVQCADFLSDLAEGLACANVYLYPYLFKCVSNLGAPNLGAPKLVAAALKLDALSEEGARQGGSSRAPKRRRGI